ncbi:MAG: PD40 domain-containing protein [Chitinophagaceae bacterium]|nr:PD40 domain-containing protein [Chitinophagaceae bacterium]
MKRIPYTLFLICIINYTNAQQGNQASQNQPAVDTAGYRIGIGYHSSLMSVYDKFEFELEGGERVTIDHEHMLVYFTQKFKQGQRYKVIPVSGTRPCSLVWGTPAGSAAEGVFNNQDIMLSAACGNPTFAIGKLNVTGIEAGETFKFTDKYGRTLSLSFSTLANLGAYPVGDPLTITQTAGPRPCMITYPSGTVPNEPFTVQCDCRRTAPPSKTKLNGQFIAPAGTKIVLRLNNSDTLIINQPANPDNTWFQTKNFSFPKSYLVGTEYSVSIKSAPQNLGCAVYENAAGTIGDSTVVRVRCDKTYDLVSRSTDNKILNTYYESFNPVIGGSGEDEGRYVAFGAYGKSMDGSSGNYRQIFLRDRKTGETKLISKSATGAEANGNCQMAAISADGKTVAFESYATNLTHNDNNGARDIYVWNEGTGLVTLISRTQEGVAANGESYEPSVSGDGRVIAYTSGASNIVPLQAVYSTPNVYVYGDGIGTIFISKDYETGKATSGYSPSISDDGTKVAFCAYSSRLVNGDNNNLWDIFLWESGKSGLKRISLTSTGGERNQGTESSSRVVAPAISGDGKFIAYATTASNIVPDDNNEMQDIFLYNIPAGSVKRMSTGNNNEEGNGDSPIGQGEKVGISYDGHWITYNTATTNLGVTKGNIVMKNTQTGKVTAITNINGGSTSRPMISKNGGYVIAGCSEKYDIRYPSSGIFTFHTSNAVNNQ